LEEIHNSLFRNGLNVKSLRARCHISDHNVASRFKLEIGVSIMAYVTRLRIEAAASCLACSQIPVAAIALATGFSSLQSFYKAFHAAHAMTPGDYRRIAQHTESDRVAAMSANVGSTLPDEASSNRSRPVRRR
jgi:transcriptional regulator GlxA family with amidase domain